MDSGLIDTGALGRATQLFADDINGDGILDIIAARVRLGTEIWIFQGSMNGDFLPAANSPLSVGDFPVNRVRMLSSDALGVPDILVSSRGEIFRFINNGSGEFVKEQIFDGFVTAIETGDFDGDGDLDIILGLGSDYGFLINDGAEGFSPLPGMPFSLNSGRILAMKRLSLDEDEIDDIVALRSKFDVQSGLETNVLTPLTSIPIFPTSDLILSTRSCTDVVQPGGTVRLEWSITNAGPYSAEDVSVLIDTPPGSILRETSPNVECSFALPSFQCDFTSGISDGSVVFGLEIEVPQDLAMAEFPVDSMVVSSSDDPNLTDNESSIGIGIVSDLIFSDGAEFCL